MKVAILGNREKTFVHPMTRGICKMLTEIGVKADLFNDGLEKLSINPDVKSPRDKIKHLIKLIRLKLLSISLKQYDAVIVVSHMPHAFTRVLAIEKLRAFCPDVPIVLYDLVYILTKYNWIQYLESCGEYSADRYDWNLVVSVVGKDPLPGGSHPMNCVGFLLDEEQLHVSPKEEFIALIDFYRPKYAKERERQIKVLESLDIKYIKLEGLYEYEEICDIYRKCSVYFVAHPESFGLPISEVQACGNIVFVPDEEWCYTHHIKDVHAAGPGELPENILCYEHNEEILTKQLREVRENFDARKNRERFEHTHPHYLYGDLDQLADFINKLKSGAIRPKGVSCP